MGDKDFIKPVLERRGQVYFGKVRNLHRSAFLAACLQSYPSACSFLPAPHIHDDTSVQL